MGCGGSKLNGNVATPPPPRTTVEVKPRKAGEPPRDVICHICGRKYTVHSIDIHIPQCEKLFHQRQEKLPEAKRKECPQLPRNVKKLSLDERNELAMKIYNDHTLVKCRFCERTFLPERLDAHMRACAKQHGEEWPPKKKARPPPTGESKNTVVCHICGRKYTIHSIDIHQKQCEKLWHDRQQKLPATKRKPVPQMPKRYRASQRNNVAMKVYEKNTLEECPHCGRTFLPDRLEVHMRSCKHNRGK